MTTTFKYKFYALSEIMPAWLTTGDENFSNHNVSAAMKYFVASGGRSIDTAMDDFEFTNPSAMLSAMDMWSNYLDVAFSTTTGTKSIEFGTWKPYYQGAGSATTFIENGGTGNYAVLLNVKSDFKSFNDTARIGNWGGWSFMHEFIHIFTGASDIGESTDLRLTILSYPKRFPSGEIDPTIKISLTPGMLDIKTLQDPAKFGVSHAQDGNTSYIFKTNVVDLGHGDLLTGIANANISNYVMTIWDAPTSVDENGDTIRQTDTDTIDASGFDSTQNLYIDLRAGHFSAIGTLGVSAATAPGGADLNGDGDPDGDTNYNVGIAFNAEIENAKGGGGADYLRGNDLRNELEGSGGNDTLEGGKGNDVLIGGSGVDTYKFDGEYGIDTIIDSDGSGQLSVGGQQITVGTLKFENVYKDEGTGYSIIKINGGSDLLLYKENDSNRIIIQNWSDGKLGLSLSGSVPSPTGNVINGDIKKKINDQGTSDSSDDMYAIVESGSPDLYSYEADGPEANAMDVINGTSAADVINGLGGSDFLSGENGNDYLDGGDEGDFLQGGLGEDTIYGRGGNDLIYAGTRVKLNPVTNIHFTPPIPRYTEVDATGFNWVSSTSVIAENGVHIDGWIDYLGGHELDSAAFGGDDVKNYLDGGEGNDSIYGGIGSDYIIGGAGLDFIQGYLGADIILSGNDNDYIFGDTANINEAGGNDMIDAGVGIDIVIAGGGDDIVFGGDGNDLIWGDYENESAQGGNDTLFGGAGNDQLVGGKGNDYLEGGSENDVLFGGDGNDILVGGAGADQLFGGVGADTIYLNLNEGDQLVGSQEEADKIILNVNKTNISATTSSSGGGASKAVMLNSNTGGSSEIVNGLIGNSDYTYTFADGSQMLHSELIGTKLNEYIVLSSDAKVIFGGAWNDNLEAVGTTNTTIFGGMGNDTVTGNSANNNLIGGAGNDTIIGGEGDDLIAGGVGSNALYGGYGNDTYIVGGKNDEASTNTINEGSGVNNIAFGFGIKASDLQFQTTTNPTELQIRFPSLFSGTHILSVFLSGTASIGQLKFQDGSTVDFQQLLNEKIPSLNLVGSSSNDSLTGSYNNDQLSGGDGNDTLVGNSGSDSLNGENGIDYLYGNNGNDFLNGGEGNDTLYGGDGNDTLEGGIGNDTLTGDYGQDIYIFNTGFGADTIIDSATYESNSHDVNVIRFGQGITSNDLIFTRSGDVLKITIAGTTDTISNIAFYGDTTSANTIERIEFFDGTAWNVTEIVAKILSSTDGNDVIRGFSTDDIINGGLGNDSLYGQNGNDTLHGGIGDDRLFGVSGDDILYGDEGGDYLDGGDGNDLMDGGEGTNNLYGQNGDDRIVAGIGADYIQGGRGNDTYLFSRGSGQDVIYNAGRNWTGTGYDTAAFIDYTDTLELGSNISPQDLIVWNDQGRVFISIYETNDSLKLYDTYGVDANGTKVLGIDAIDFVKFSSGLTWDATTLLNNSITLKNYDGIHAFAQAGTVANDQLYANGVVYGLAGDDTITGSSVDDYIVGGTGNDILIGGDGSDYYVFEAGHGNDQIENQDTTPSGSEDIILFRNLNSADVVLSKSGYDLILVTGQNSNIIVKDYLLNASNQIDKIKFADGVIWDSAYINAFMLAATNGDDVLNGTDGDDTISGLAGNDVISGGLGNDALNGDAGNDSLNGGTGSDILDGGTGADTLVGGSGNDTYIIDDAGDAITEASNAGTDTVQSSISYTLGTNLENLILLGTSNINGTGNSVANVITGNSGDNVLNGGAGNDTMVGGLGNDTYTVDATGDIVTEAASAGTDLVNVAITTSGGTYTLAANVENATLTNTVAYTLTGNALDNVLTGNAAANTLNGGDGNDTLNGLAGNDTMVGGLGNDTYTIDATGDVVTEAASAGTDTVNVAITTASGTYTLAANVENATLINTVAYNLTGNALNNVLTGNAQANSLNGGAGTDTLVGGAGNDTYTIDVTTDVITENLNEGTDLVNVAIATASGSYTLAANVENATLTNTVAFTLTGNALDNILTGNTAANTLNGGDGNDILNGLAGNDTMVGGMGNDIYTTDATGDVITEAANAGVDTVNVARTTSGGSYTLVANIENATLTNTVAYTLTGNALDNVLTGNAAANTLNGGDGNDTLNGLAGNDTMVGGLGNDTYTIDATGDVVTEAASAGTDTVNVAITTAGGTYTVAANVENATLINTVAYNLTGNALANFILGNAANNTLTDTAGGNDILQGLAGIDTFNDTVGNNLFDGGIGNDIITAGTGRDLLIGGVSNDTITTGTGYDVIVFNKGDGQDIVNSSTGADNTISLGGNFAYSDLSLTKSTNDLIIKMGASDQITLKDWYASGATNKSVVNLQVIAEAIQGFSLGGADALRNNKVETFNFTNLVAAFDAAGATANWQLTDARLTAHLQAGSDTSAIGGDLAYQYGKNSNLTGMGLLNAQSVINNANFGQTAQTLNNPSVWQAELVKMA